MSGCKFYNTIQYNTIQAIIIVFGNFFIAKLKNYLKHLNAFSWRLQKLTFKEITL